MPAGVGRGGWAVPLVLPPPAAAASGAGVDVPSRLHPATATAQEASNTVTASRNLRATIAASYGAHGSVWCATLAGRYIRGRIESS